MLTEVRKVVTLDWYDSNGSMREISEVLEMFWVHV